MKEIIPMNVFERLEREWRMIDPERKSPTPVSPEATAMLPKRVIIRRFDDAQIGTQD